MTERALKRFGRRLAGWLTGAPLERVGHFLLYTAGRFDVDGCARQAAGLSYASLLAIVPLLAIALAVLSAFPAFDEVREDIQALVFQNFLPQTSETVSRQVSLFLANASKATAPGVLALAVTALLLLSNINSAFNAIWRVSAARPLALRLLVYWALLTLGPLLLGASLSLSSYAFAVVQLSGLDSYTGWLVPFSRLISVSLAALGLAAIFFVVPNRTVQIGHALIGGLTAAVLFELLKSAFGLYLTHFPSYQMIYGALSTIPVFLVWMYLSWAVILFGAEITAALPEWRAAQARGRQIVGPGERLALALAILARLREVHRAGGSLTERALVRGLPATPAETDETLRALRRARVVARTMRGRWLLARDLAGLTLAGLMELLSLDLDVGAGWPLAAKQAVDGLEQAARPMLETSVEQLLAAAEEAGTGVRAA